MEHLVGWIILGLIVLLVFGVTPLIAWLAWRGRVPRDYYRGVGILYRANTLKPWHGLERAIDLALEELELRWPSKTELKDFWIRIYAYTETVPTKESPSGYVYPTTNLPASAPRNQAEAEKVMIVGGTYKVERMLPIWPFKKHYIIEVRQTRAVSDWENRLRIGDGPYRSAGESTLFHELVQHVIAERVYGDGNRYHKKPDLDAVEEGLYQKYKEIRRV